MDDTSEALPSTMTIDEVLLGQAAQERTDGDKTFQLESEYVHTLLKSLVLGTKASNSLPTEDGDYHQHCASVPEFSEKSGDQGERILHLMQNLMSHISSTNDFDITDMEDPSDSDALEGITGVVDSVLEKVDSFLDQV